MSSNFFARKYEEHCLTQSRQAVAHVDIVVGALTPRPFYDFQSRRRSRILYHLIGKGTFSSYVNDN